MKYASSNEFLFGAGFDNILTIAEIFSVPLKMLAKNIRISTNSNRFSFDKTNPKYRSYLAYYLLSYFYRPIRIGNYRYDEELNIFINPKKEKIDINSLIEEISKIYSLCLNYFFYLFVLLIRIIIKF